ncbi:MAG: 6-hydroxymethylpterin diphosphokinase MptE-like protein [Pseudomonadota bacterium]|nr:6-hydroxymethylpterin diphosphokinase MptE-like protein [Pseudomonadota bacterium]
MLSEIKFHIHPDENIQQQVEQTAAKKISHYQQRSLLGIRRYIPSLSALTEPRPDSTTTLFCNQHGEINLVDALLGTVVYGEHPFANCESQVDDFLRNPTVINRSIDTENKDTASVLVVLGVGLGYHLPRLLSDIKPAHIIIYEPDIDHFQASLAGIDWCTFLENAEKQDTAIYCQIGSTGESIHADIEELSQHVQVNNFYLFKHLHRPIFNLIYSLLTEQPWQAMANRILSVKQDAKIKQYMPLWTEKRSGDWHSAHLDQKRKAENLDALREFFPDVYALLNDYEPTNWTPVASEKGEVNLQNIETGALYFAVETDEESVRAGEFIKNPNQDGVFLNYQGGKLHRNLHYQLVEKCADELVKIEIEKAQLPDKLKTLLIFGLGTGIGLRDIMASAEIEKLFICEPNSDFFYATLFAIDWRSVFTSFQKDNGKIYLFIGDDTSHLIEDFLSQFHTVGSYHLSQAYFYRGYYNANFEPQIKQLQDQLRVILAMGDYFDHAYYSISNTALTLQNGASLLHAESRALFNAEMKDVPVFLIGNGPSLDISIEAIKEAATSAIIVSCGTSLQTLYRHGITPDFHAEIETNRANYDWCLRLADKSYLQNITLLSCNGIHPDTVSLFKQVLLAFKKGEPSTSVTRDVIDTSAVAHLNYAFPTVANFAINLFLELGFRQLYLFGIDLGFVSDDQHHSKFSGYYLPTGEEAFARTSASSMVIEGNYRPAVRTKYEFKIAKHIIEQTLKNYPADIYNVSDGARIYGARPLLPDDVFVIENAVLKESVKSMLSSDCVVKLETENFTQRLLAIFPLAQLMAELHQLLALFSQKVTDKSALLSIVEEQRALIASSVQQRTSLIFFLLHGSINHINAVFYRALSASDFDQALPVITNIVDLWQQFIEDVIATIEHDEFGLDAISSLYWLRRQYTSATESDDVEKTFLSNAAWRKVRLRNFSSKHLSTVFFSGASPDIKALISDDRPVVYLPYFNADEETGFDIGGSFLKSIEDVADSFPVAQGIIIPKGEGNRETLVSRYQPFLADSDKYYLYSAPDFILIADNKIAPEKRVLANGDRLAYLPRLTEISLIL